MTPDDSNPKHVHPRTRDISIDALFDDLFGLNWRALKTLCTSFTQPVNLSCAAWHAHWEDRYTPSFRLWFTLVAILFFFQFFWASEDSALIALYAAQMEGRGLELPEGITVVDASRYYARINFSILPFASAFCLFGLGYLFRAWGQAVPVVVRIRYIFAVVIPSTALSLPIFWLLGFASHAQATPFLILSWILPIPVDSWVAYRSVYSGFTGFGRWWRSLAVGLAIFLAMVVSALLSGYLAGLWIDWQHAG